MAKSGAPRDIMVLYATERRYRSRFKFKAFDERGRLEFRAGSLVYTSQGRSVHIPPRAKFGLVRPTVPWGNFLFVIPMLVAFFVVVPEAMPSPGSTLTNALIGLSFGLLFLRLQRWVRVEFTEADGTPRTAYFTRGRAWGYSALFGAASLMERMQAALVAAGPQGAPTFSPSGARRDL